MSLLFAISRAIEALVTGIGKVASFLFVPMMLIITYDISQRKYLEFDSGFADTAIFHVLSSTKLQEMEWHLHATLFLLCLGYAYVKDAHVRIELVRDKLSNNTRAWIEILGCLIFLIPYCWVVTELSVKFAMSSYRINEISSAQTGLTHRWIIKSMLPVGFMLLSLAGIAVLFKCLIFLFGPERLRAAAGSHIMPQHQHIDIEMEHELEEAGVIPSDHSHSSGNR